MKIYIITKGGYSAYHICAVTEDEELAEKLKQYYSDKWEDARIEEYDTCSVVPTPTIEYWFWFDPSGKLIEENREEYKGNPPDEPITYRISYDGGFDIYVIENDRDKAFKIACDMRAKMLAERMGL